MSKVRTDTIASRQIPSFVRHDHPTFVAFVEAYYKFMEDNGYTRNLESLTDIDETLDEFINEFDKQINHATNIDDYKFDKRLLLKRFKDIYLAKGSEASYRLLMRLLFDKEMEMFYPGQHLFSLDAGEWRQQLAVNITNITGDPNLFAGNNATITFPDGKNYIVFVDSVDKLTDVEYELSISREFVEDIPFGTTVSFSGNSGDVTATVSPTTVKYNIQDSGANFTVGQIFEIVTTTGSGTFIKVKRVNSTGGITAIEIVKFGTGYDNNFFSTLSPIEAEVKTGSTSSTPTTDEFGDTHWDVTTEDIISGYVDSGLITKPTYWSNFWFANRSFAAGTILHYDGRLYTVENSGNSGSTAPTHTSGTVLNGGIELTYLSAGTTVDSEYGPEDYAGEPVGEFFFDSSTQQSEEEADTAKIVFLLGVLKKYPGFYVNSRGFIDDFSFLRDDLYWQEFSYVVKINEQLKKFKNHVLSMLHPAGLKLFADYNIGSIFDLDVSVQVLEFEKTFSTFVLSDSYTNISDSIVFDAEFNLENAFPEPTESQTIDVPFNTTWQTDNTGTSSDNQITLPLSSSGSYNFIVNWGDGNSDTITSYDQSEITHTYAVAGEYDVSISGELEGWYFNNGGDKLKLKEISRWGDFKPGNTGGQFYGCANLSISATDMFNTTGVTTLDSIFRDCSSITSLDVNSWDTSLVTSLDNAFKGASSITSLDVSNWDTSSVTTSIATFQDTGITDIAVDQWDITANTDMSNMFNGVTLDTENYDNILVAWEAQAVQDNVNFHAGNSTFSTDSANNARDALVADHSWTITDGGLVVGDLFDSFGTIESEIGYSGYWDPFYTDDNNGQDPYVV